MMDSVDPRIKNDNGRVILLIWYSRAASDWDIKIAQALARHGFLSRQVKVIAMPAPANQENET
jgi:hypothetical protein